MDGSSADHSDSDSGESWTILEHSPLPGDEAPQISENNLSTQEEVVLNTEKDEDTDGISIISDSEPESLLPCEIGFDRCTAMRLDETGPKENFSGCPISNTPSNFDDQQCYETMREDNFLGINSVKHKTYVHRRNKRLSTVLNIIVLGSVITAAGMAIGHMWGVRDDCAVHSTPSVNKILSNLYKLQEENLMLKKKLKELTLFNNFQKLQRKSETEKLTPKKKTEKEFEGEVHTKTDDFKYVNSNLLDNKSGKDFWTDIDKLKKTYKENKSWLDDEISKRLRTEQESLKRLKRSQKFIKNKTGKRKTKKDENLNRQLEKMYAEEQEMLNIVTIGDMNNVLNVPEVEKKVTYADSLKFDRTFRNSKPLNKEHNDQSHKDNVKKRKSKVEREITTESSLASDEDLIKDDRYIESKFKLERKKNDRQKQHKKQKRRNKYEQWEMKSGYMKDYDDLSLTSFQQNENLKNSDQNPQNRNSERKNCNDKYTETDGPITLSSKPTDPHEDNDDSKEKDVNWFDKRAALRHEARNKLEQELFEGSSQNPAGWYFRRMQRREQCRAKGDNSTHRKLSKRNMNFKTKH